MSGFPWDQMQRVVKTGNYSAANDEWNTFKAAVQRSDAQALATQASQATLAWTFLLGFASEKPLYRKHIVNVVEQLREVPGWSAAFASVPPDMLGRVDQLHTSLQEAFPKAAGAAAATTPAAAATTTPPAAAAAAPVESGAGPDLTPPPPAASSVPTSTIPVASLPVSPLPLDIPPSESAAAPETIVQPSEPAMPDGSPASDHSEYHRKRPPLDSEGPSHHKHPPSPASQSPLVKRYKPFIQRANELEAEQPVIAHYCRVHAVEQLIYAKRRGETDPESYALLLQTLEQAEQTKKTLNLTLGKEDMEEFAYMFYEDAISGQGRASDTQLYMAGNFIEVLAQFHNGQLPPALQYVADYCTRRAYEMRECYRAGKAPPPSAAPKLPPKGSIQAAGYPAPAAAAAAPPQPAYQPSPVAPAPPAPAPAPPAPQPPQVQQQQYIPVMPPPTAQAAPQPYYMPPPAAAAAAAPAAAAVASAPAAAPGPMAAYQAPPPSGLIPPPSAEDSAAWASWSTTKRQAEARKRAEHASKVLGGSLPNPEVQARRLVLEALQLIDGMN